MTRTKSLLLIPVLLWGVLPAFAQEHSTHHGGQPSDQATPDHMERRFDAEEFAKVFDDPARDAWQLPDRVISTLALKPGQRVADIGAGTGYFSVRLAKSPAAPLVYGVDVEPSMVDYLRARAEREKLGNIVPVLAAPDSPKLPQPVDVVLVVDTYHHIPNRPAYFRNLRASMTPGARLVIIDFKKDSPDGPPVEFRFTEDQITSELAKAGFRLASRHDFLPRQQFLVYEMSDGAGGL